MTKKHYISIAAAIRNRLAGGVDYPASYRATRAALIRDMVVLDLCPIFKADNPAFDQRRFIEACGMEAD